MLYIDAECPYARRAVYASQFKSANIEIISINQEHQPNDYKEINPTNNLPLLVVKQGEKKFHITGSRQIAEYLNPVKTGRIIQPAKTVLDMQISVNLEPLFLYLLKFCKTGNKRSFETVTEILQDINENYLNQGNYASGLVGYTGITMPDLILYPIVDYLYTRNDSRIAEIMPFVAGNNIERWYRMTSNSDWILKGKELIAILSKKPKI